MFLQELDAELVKCEESIEELGELSSQLLPSVGQHDQQLIADHLRYECTPGLDLLRHGTITV